MSRVTPRLGSPISRNDDIHVSSYPWRSCIWRKTRPQRLVMLEQTSVYPLNAYVLACVEIQRMWRGVLLRRRVLAKYLYRNFKRVRAVDDERVMAAYMRVDPPATQAEMTSCVHRVVSRAMTVLKQAEYSRWLAYQKFGIYWVAATSITRAWLSYRYQKKKRRVFRPFYLTREDAAAAKIQNLWKSYINYQIFRFYVDLIKFREQTDARLMLKCINPHEAGLIDPAAGVHVRFRLGGHNFPPTIYYKMFVHNPICDLGALAPRDYTALCQPPPKMLFNSKHASSIPEDHSGWYRRVENNDWRPISEKDLRNVEHHAQKLVEAKRGFAEDSPFHYSKVVRKSNKELKAKAKRRQWLLEMYAAAAVDPNNLRGNTKEDLKAIADQFEDEELEASVKDLLDWTQTLDYDSYQKDWQALATALGD
mmetsp:Transcript_136121/g.236121  ORF Transcript_136121/g.236121 Transcript_136121/m.236121 type:complete len:421 (-) Transcript_136121:13-1275(-)